MGTRAWWALVGALLIASVVLNSGPLLLITVLLALSGLASSLWGRFALSEVSYQRTLSSSRLGVGDTLTMQVAVTNAKPLPLAWLRVDDELPEELVPVEGELGFSGRPGRRILTNLFSLRWYERVRRSYRFTATARGAYTLGPVRLTSGDMFGFRSQTRLLTRSDEVIVHPRVRALNELGLKHAQPFGDGATRRRIQPNPLLIAGARPYVPGDNPRYIHWKASARRPELQTRVFDPGAEPHILIFLNIQSMAQGYQGVVAETAETAITVAASLAAAAYDQKQSVGLFVNSPLPGQEYYMRVPASRRPDQLMRILDMLARLTYLSMMPFDSLLRVETRNLPFGAAVLAITAISDEAIISSLLDVHAAGHPTNLVQLGEQHAHPVPDEIRVFRVPLHQATWQAADAHLQLA